MTEKTENSFRSILKGTSIFGGVQIFNILISAIRLKLVAVILGPSGMGVAGLLTSASLSIQQLSSLGLNLAMVKETGAAREREEQLRHILASVRPLILLTALTGALICLFLPGTLSAITFGDQKYKTSFLILAAAVFFSITGSALMSVLQGLHQVKRLSKASIIGSVTGLATGVPMYWLWGTAGIAPAMTVLAMTTCLWYYLSLRKSLQVKAAPWDREIHLPIMRRILTMGLILMSNELFKSLVNYLVNVYVRTAGGMDDVGFYSSCSTMTSQYSAIVFTAMAMDYLPRLAGLASDNAKMCEAVNRQIEIAGLLIAPVVGSVILLAPWVIEILQTEKFIAATPLLRLLALAVVPRALMSPLGYIVFAKDNRKLFFWMESVGANLLTLTLACGGYRLYGLDGLGIAAIADCLICLTVYVAVNHKLYGYRPTRRAAAISGIALGSAAAMAAICLTMEGTGMAAAGTLLLTAVAYRSGRRLLRLWKQN